jgi:hypothetical protein
VKNWDIMKTPKNYFDESQPDETNMLSEPAAAYAYTPRVAEENPIRKTITYAYLQAEMQRQDLLISEGKMTKPILIDDVFTLEQQAEFNKKITIDDIFYGRWKGR